MRERRKQKDMHRNKKVFSGPTKARDKTYLRESLVLCPYGTDGEIEHRRRKLILGSQTNLSFISGCLLSSKPPI